MEDLTKTGLGIIGFIVLASALLIVDITPDDKIYSCAEPDLVGYCFKLSNVNDAGFQTRCYYNESAPTKYKNCKTGWEIFTSGIIEPEPYPMISSGKIQQERCNNKGCVLI